MCMYHMDTINYVNSWRRLHYIGPYCHKSKRLHFNPHEVSHEHTASLTVMHSVAGSHGTTEDPAKRVTMPRDTCGKKVT